jgi:hypothetical protein
MEALRESLRYCPLFRMRRDLLLGDRLIGSSIPYDDMVGCISGLPAAYCGGSTLTASYFSNDMVQSQIESKIKLALGVACFLGVAYSLIAGNLWPAATCLAISGFCVLVSYRRERQLERRP